MHQQHLFLFCLFIDVGKMALRVLPQLLVWKRNSYFSFSLSYIGRRGFPAPSVWRTGPDCCLCIFSKQQFRVPALLESPGRVLVGTSFGDSIFLLFDLTIFKKRGPDVRDSSASLGSPIARCWISIMMMNSLACNCSP